MTGEQAIQRVQKLESALLLILEEGAVDCHGYETTIVKIAREALGISEEEFWENSN